MTFTDKFSEGYKKVTGKDCGCAKRQAAMKQAGQKVKTEAQLLADALRSKFGKL